MCIEKSANMKNIEIVVIIFITFAILVNCKNAKVKDMFFKEAGSRVSDLHPNCSYPCHTVNYFKNIIRKILKSLIQLSPIFEDFFD